MNKTLYLVILILPVSLLLSIDYSIDLIFDREEKSELENRSIQEEKLNILIIMVDDMNDWVGYLEGYGGEVHTPNIDRLAGQGMAFTNAHVSAPSCTPSRNTVLLGKFTSTTGLYGNDQWWKPAHPDVVTLPQYFKNHGYYSAGSGKVFHHPPGHNPPVSWNEYQDQVFDDPWNFSGFSPENYWLNYGYRGPMIENPEWLPLHGLDGVRQALDWGAIPGLAFEEYGDVQAMKFGREFLKREHDDPFFLAVGIYRPHIPWYAPQKYLDMYPLEDIVLPEVKDNVLDDVPEMGRRFAGRGSNDYDEIMNLGKWKEAVQGYLASISFADAQVGQILDALENSDYLDNTIVVLWSDHGFHLGTKEHWHKWTLWEESTRVPFVIKAPGVTEPGSVTHEAVGDIHLYPTLLSLAGLPEKEGLDGHDLTPLLKNPDSEWKYPAITIHLKGNAAVRSRDWRYIRYSDGGEELYNHRNDPNEWYNLAGQSRYADIIEQHKRWIPETFEDPVGVGTREAWYFDPHDYTWLHRETGEYVDGHH